MNRAQPASWKLLEGLVDYVQFPPQQTIAVVKQILKKLALIFQSNPKKIGTTVF
jgi:hypothetical protein